MSKHGKQTHVEESVEALKRGIREDQPIVTIQHPTVVAPRSHFTGTCYTLTHKPHEGFANYAIVSLHIEDGAVVKEEVGQAFNAMEALLKLELQNGRHLEHLRRTYPVGFRHG